MFRAASFIIPAATLTLLSGAALAEQGRSSSWGSVGWDPVIGTSALTPQDRQWNIDHQALYQAQDSADFFAGRNPWPGAALRR